jgi:anion-transporting  ArsA/GET3 family ATPase
VSGRLARLLQAQRLLVFVGEGGVGKTSCAAAVGLAGARLGRRVAVLTIDPAPRLGQALEIGALTSEPRTVADSHTAPGSVSAMRLDTRATFDRVVRRYVPDDRIASLILESPIYQTLASGVGGSEAFMALQRIDELVLEGSYDLLVLDTPPAVHARELLSAPSRLAALVETEAMEMLANPAAALARLGSAFTKTLALGLLPFLERMTGAHLRQQLSSFAEHFSRVVGGARQRADAVARLLAQPETAFLHVVRASTAGVAPALALERSLLESKIEVAAVVANRMTPSRGPDRQAPLSTRLAGAPPSVGTAANAMERDLDRMRQVERTALARLRSGLAELPRTTVPAVIEVTALEEDIGTLSDLARLATAMTDHREG